MSCPIPDQACYGKFHHAAKFNFSFSDLKLLEFQWLWSTYLGIFNDTTQTYDMGDIHNASARALVVASSSKIPYVISRVYQHVENDTEAIRTKYGGSLMITLESICTFLHLRCKVTSKFSPPKLPHPALITLNSNIEAVRQGLAAFAAFPVLDDQSQFKAEELVAVRWRIDREYSIIIHNSHLQMTSPPLSRLAAKIFEKETWIFLFLAFLILWISFVAVSLLSSQSLQRTESFGAKVIKVLEISWNMLYRIVAGDFDYGGFLHGKYRKVRILLMMTLYVMTFVIVAAFVSKFTVVLTAPSWQWLPFQNVKELLQSDFEIVTFPEIQRALLTAQQSKDLYDLGERSVPWNKSTTDWAKLTAATGEERRVHLVDDEKIRLLANYSCAFVIALPGLLRSPVGVFWFRRHDPLIEHFETAMNWLTDSGILVQDAKYFERYLTTGSQTSSATCLPKSISNGIVPQKRAITIADVSFPLMMILTSLIIGLIIFVIESVFVPGDVGLRSW